MSTTQIESDIPAPVLEFARKYSIDLIEREEDFTARSEKLVGQEFEGATAVSALNKALEGMGIEDRYIAGGPVAVAAVLSKEEIAAEPTETLPGLNKGKKSRKAKVAKPDDGKRGKTVAEAVAESPKVEPETLSEPETKPAKKAKAKSKVKEEALDEADYMKDPKIAKVVDQLSKQIVKGEAAIAKVVKEKEAAKPSQLSSGKSREKAAPAVASLAEAREKRQGKILAASKPATQEALKNLAEEQKAKKAAPTAVVELKIKAAAKAKVEAEPAKKQVVAKAEDNGNGRKRGTRWWVKCAVLADPTASVEIVLASLPKGVSSTKGSTGSIRMDFLATMRAAKAMTKLKADIAKRVPEAKSTRAASAVLDAVNRIVIENPDLDSKAVIEELKVRGHRGASNGSISASRAAIIESMAVLKVGGALR